MTIFIRDNAGRRFQRLHFDSFCNSAFNLFRKGSHIGHTSPVDDANFFCAETDCSADCIHGYISASDDSYFLTG